MANVITLHNEVKLMTDLIADTLSLIHHTNTIPAIKLLVNTHDILDLTLTLERQFQEYRYQPPWNTATYKDLDSLRSELLVRHAFAFKPPTLLPPYYKKMGDLFTIMNLRLESL